MPVKAARKRAKKPEDVSNVVAMRPGSGRGRGNTIGRAHAHTNPAAISAAERKARAVQLRRAGASYQQIVDLLRADTAHPIPPGYTATEAYKDVRDAIDKVVGVPTQEYIDESVDRLRGWLMALHPAASKGDPEAIRAGLSVEKNLQQLHGIRLASRIELTGADGGPITVQALTDPDEALAAAEAALDSVLGLNG